MQLILVLSAAVAAVSAMSTTERNPLQKRKIIIDGDDNKFGEIVGGPVVDGKGNPIDPKTLIDPALAGTSKIMGDRQSEELNAESVSAKIADAEAQLLKADAAMAQADKAVAAIPTDINELINTHMTPEQKAELELKDVQKMWYGRVLKKFNDNLQAKKPIDLNELINTDLNEDGRKRLGFTDAQNAWFAGVLGKLAASSGAQVTYRPELKQAGDSEKKEDKGVTSEEKGKQGKSNTDGKDGKDGKGAENGKDGENGKDVTTGKTDKALPVKGASAAKNATSPATAANATRTKTNITASNGSRSTGMGSHAVHESWAVLAGAVAAAMVLFV
ncbi:hypothetical protein OXX69_004823 [Metschnikowia pulcherrima]